MSDIIEEKSARPSSDDIRQWAREQGRDISDSGALPRGLRREYNEAHGIQPTSRQVDYEKSSEVAPQVKDPTISDRVSSVFRGRKARPSTRSKARKPRVSAEDVISAGWSLVAQMIKPVSRPMARAIAMEAPVAGKLLDDPIKGTMIDKLLQPFARAEDTGKVFAALAMPPLFVGLIDRFPDRAEQMMPAFRKSLKFWIDVAGPKLEEMIREEEEFEDKYGAAIDAMIISFFPELFEQASTENQDYASAPVG